MTPSLPHEHSVRDRIRGSQLAGACGDALGAPVEFMSRAALEIGDVIQTLATDLTDFPECDVEAIAARPTATRDGDSHGICHSTELRNLRTYATCVY